MVDLSTDDTQITMGAPLTPSTRTDTPVAPAAPQDTVHLTPYALLCIGLLIALGFSLGCSEFIVIGIQPEIARDFGVPLSQAGMLMSAFSITYAIATPVLALSTGRIPRRTLLIGYSILFCAGNSAAVLATSFEMLLAARVLIGLVSGALLAIGATYIPELAGMKRISICISLVYAAFSIAMVISTSAGKFIAATWEWHYAVIGTLVMSLVVCAALILVLPRTGATDIPATAREQMPLLRDPRIIAGTAIFMFGVGSIYVFYGYVTPYLENILGMGTLEASGALMAYGGMCFASNLLSGWCDARFGVKTMLVSFPIQAALLFGLWAVGPAMPWALVIILGIALTMYVVSTPCISLFMTTAAMSTRRRSRWRARWSPRRSTWASPSAPPWAARSSPGPACRMWAWWARHSRSSRGRSRRLPYASQPNDGKRLGCGGRPSSGDLDSSEGPSYTIPGYSGCASRRVSTRLRTHMRSLASCGANTTRAIRPPIS